MNETNTESGASAESKDERVSLRKQYNESVKNPIQPGQDRSRENYWAISDGRIQQLKIEVDLIGEIAILEWVLQEKQTWLTTWMRKRS